jgi:aminoglycoside 3-N-acetyltransferase
MWNTSTGELENSEYKKRCAQHSSPELDQMVTSPTFEATGPKVSPDELTEGFQRLELNEGDSVMMHASLESFGEVDGGAAMVLHRLLGVLGKGGTLMMPTFTSVTRHSTTHDDYAKPGCWCEGKEDRHIPFIPELQPDKNIGSISHRLCSWPASRRSRHPAYSFAAVGKHTDELVREYAPLDPLLPIKKFLGHDPLVLMVGTELDSTPAIHVAEEKRIASKFVKERALTVSSKGTVWVDVKALGCSKGFGKLHAHLSPKEYTETKIGLALIKIYPMRKLIDSALALLDTRPRGLVCDNRTCLSCVLAGVS